MDSKPVICLMGPTASGKTEVAMRLVDAFPLELVSVDSALVYRGMNIGTAKPDAATLDKYPHRLVDIRDPEDSYSVGEFIRDAHREIDAIHRQGRLPLLVGGTMMYFRSLVQGMAELPGADRAVRADLDRQAALRGWPAMHAELAAVDPDAAVRIHPNDSQRIQRALEVCRVSDRTLTDWHRSTRTGRGDYRYLPIALIPEPRAVLHARIAERLELMLVNDFIEEVQVLRRRKCLTSSHASMRAVGYRQIWRYLDGEYDAVEMRSRTLVATRQLAKRQLTWLRSEPGLFAVNPLEVDAFVAISAHFEGELAADKN